MKKAVASLVLTVCLSLAACQSPIQDETGSTSQRIQTNDSLSESQIVAQIQAAFAANHSGEPTADVQLLEKDGAISYYQANPDGLGGYILYSGAMELYTYTEGQGTVECLSSQFFLGDFVTDISSDNTMALGFALFEGPNAEQIGARVTDLKTGYPKDYLVDNFTVGHQVGAGVFSPDNSQMAFAVTETDSGNENTVVYLVDLGTESMSEFSKNTGAVKLTWEGDELTVEAAY